jgi:hypothetical protein
VPEEDRVWQIGREVSSDARALLPAQSTRKTTAPSLEVDSTLGSIPPVSNACSMGRCLPLRGIYVNGVIITIVLLGSKVHVVSVSFAADSGLVETPTGTGVGGEWHVCLRLRLLCRLRGRFGLASRQP